MTSVGVPLRTKNISSWSRPVSSCSGICSPGGRSTRFTPNDCTPSARRTRVQLPVFSQSSRWVSLRVMGKSFDRSPFGDCTPHGQDVTNFRIKLGVLGVRIDAERVKSLAEEAACCSGEDDVEDVRVGKTG